MAVCSGIMSKVSSDQLLEAVQAVLNYSQTLKKRNFTETVELQVGLKNYDPQKEKRFSGNIRLPHVPRPHFKVAIMGDEKAIGEAKTLGFECFSENDLKKYNKDKKKVKALANAYGAFLASASLIRKVPRLLGPGLNKAGKFPTVLTATASMNKAVEDVKAQAKFALKSKKSLCIGVAVGNVNMTPDEIIANVQLSINFLASLLPKNWQQIKRAFIKSSMGPSQRIYGF